MEEFLKPKLQEIKNKSFDEKFNIIAHSMGGFVALDYLYDQSYQNDIDKVVLEGTPLLGSGKVYPAWEGGLIPEDWSALRIYLRFLQTKNISKDFFDLIHEYFPSTKQLMPIYNYVVKSGNEINFWKCKNRMIFFQF